jgi:hypothetical protein
MPILQGIKGMPDDARQDIILHDEVPRTTIQQDISIFLKDEFSKIRESYNDDRPPNISLDYRWPGDEILQTLIDMTVPLFIVAATVYRFVGNLYGDPPKRLTEILKPTGMRSMSQMGQIGQTYRSVLNNWAVILLDSRDMRPRYQEFRVIVRSIITLAEPLFIRFLIDLINVPREDIWSLLRPLYSVIWIPADFETSVRTLYLSFGEFLLSDKLRYKSFEVDGPATHRILFTKYLKLLLRPEGLRQNLYDLEYSG